MNTFTDTVLSTVDRFASHLSSLSSLLDRLVEHVTPQVTVHACSGQYCKTVCTFFCNQGESQMQTVYTATTRANCDNHVYNCSTNIGCGGICN